MIEYTECYQECRETGALIHSLLVEMLSELTTKKNSITAPQIITHRITVWSSNSSSVGYIQRAKSKDLNTYVYNHVHRSTIHNGQKLEAT